MKTKLIERVRCARPESGVAGGCACAYCWSVSGCSVHSITTLFHNKSRSVDFTTNLNSRNRPESDKLERKKDEQNVRVKDAIENSIQLNPLPITRACGILNIDVALLDSASFSLEKNSFPPTTAIAIVKFGMKKKRRKGYSSTVQLKFVTRAFTWHC